MPSESQTRDLPNLLTTLENHQPHILCGDLNIPRHHNPLYDELLKQHADAIPTEYESSLDKSLHRLGESEAHTHLFTDFMVDHLLIQPPYQVSSARLEFGLSDHAAIVTEIEK